MRLRPLAIGTLAFVGAVCLAVFFWYGAPAPEAPLPVDPEAAAVPPAPVGGAAFAARYAGSRACADCHPREFENHFKSPHAHTLRPANIPEVIPLFRNGQQVVDRERKLTYRPVLSGGAPAFEVAGSGGVRRTEKPAYVVGSGRLGYTFLLRRGDLILESRLSYFPNPGRWDWTPGQEWLPPGHPGEGKVQSPDAARRCFTCHSTVVFEDAGGLKPERSVLDVGCERCHGPGRGHVDEARRGAKHPGGIYRYTRATAAIILRLCADCHRGPGSVPQDLVERDPDLPRFAGTALAASRCYLGSGGRLSCLTCHDPHRRVSPVAADYVRACLGCHDGKPGNWRTCPVNPRDACVGCHMPARTAGFGARNRFHTHLIKSYLQ